MDELSGPRDEGQHPQPAQLPGTAVPMIGHMANVLGDAAIYQVSGESRAPQPRRSAANRMTNQGKGLDAAGRCAAVLAAFRELAFAEADLVKLAEQTFCV